MHKIKNLTNSPFDLQAVAGKVVLPAFGEVNAEFDPAYLDLLRAARTVDVVADGGGEIDRLRAEYKELTGKDADGRWKADRIQSEIDKALEA